MTVTLLKGLWNTDGTTLFHIPDNMQFRFQKIYKMRKVIGVLFAIQHSNVVLSF